MEVKADDHSGEVASTDELREALTEAIWLQAREIRVSIYSKDGANLSIVLEDRPWSKRPPLQVAYHSGSAHARAVLRTLVEAALPDVVPGPERFATHVGVPVGLLFSGTLSSSAQESR
jgi:hypothetical protein